MTTFSDNNFPRAGFRRRLASWFYDVLIATSVYMTAGAISFFIFYLLITYQVLDLGVYQHDIDLLMETPWLKWTNELWKLTWVGLFFVFFWAKSGQTLGMKAWRLRLQNQDGSLISKTTGVKRLLPTLLGLGNLTVLFDRKNKLSLQDRLTDTEVVVLSLAANKGRL